jgi:hypothetical protein
MIKTALAFFLLAFATASWARTPLERMYELYDSSSTSPSRKQILRHHIETRETVESRRRAARKSSGYGVADVLKGDHWHLFIPGGGPIRPRLPQ